MYVFKNALCLSVCVCVCVCVYVHQKHQTAVQVAVSQKYLIHPDCAYQSRTVIKLEAVIRHCLSP